MPPRPDLDDIQHFLLTRTPALAARYEFLSFASATPGRAWLAGLVDKVGTGQSVGTTSNPAPGSSTLPAARARSCSPCSSSYTPISPVTSR